MYTQYRSASFIFIYLKRGANRIPGSVNLPIDVSLHDTAYRVQDQGVTGRLEKIALASTITCHRMLQACLQVLLGAPCKLLNSSTSV